MKNSTYFYAEIKYVNHSQTPFCSCDRDVFSMISICENDLIIPKMYPHTKNELYRSRLSKVRPLQTDTQTDT